MVRSVASPAVALRFRAPHPISHVASHRSKIAMTRMGSSTIFVAFGFVVCLVALVVVPPVERNEVLLHLPRDVVVWVVIRRSLLENFKVGGIQ